MKKYRYVKYVFISALACSLSACFGIGGGNGNMSISSSQNEELKPVDPRTISFLDSQIDHLTLGNAVLQWGPPTFFTQTGHNNTRTAVWIKRDAKFSYGDFLGQFDPTNTYGKVNSLFGGSSDEGWELRATFNQHDVMIDWRYKEW